MLLDEFEAIIVLKPLIANASEAMDGQREQRIASSPSLLTMTGDIKFTHRPHLGGLAAQVARVLPIVKRI